MVRFPFLEKKFLPKRLASKCKFLKTFMTIDHHNFAKDDNIDVIQRLPLLINMSAFIYFQFAKTQHNTPSKLI